MSEETKMRHADELSYKVIKKMEVREKKTWSHQGDGS